MGKTIDELNLDQTLIRQEALPAEGDVRKTAWYAFVKDIEELRAGGEVAYAEETLAGIQETVERTQRVTAGQQRAVDNIAATRGRSGSRRYEGYSRKRW